MLSREEYTQKWKHEWRGMLLDAALTGLKGAELSLWLRGMERKIDQHLAQMYSDAQPANNGVKPNA